MASSSTASIHKSFKYDVFLSFRGEDTRTNFVDHLYNALQQQSIYTYKDGEAIKKGNLISAELIGSIEGSRFYIIVFSRNYASSSWCLDELVKIMECHKMTDHTAYPVFYDVEPTEVRNQIGTVGEAFVKHENDEAAGKWKEALKEAANLAGWELKNTANGHEAKFIQKIVEEISLQLRSSDFDIDEKLVGMETRVKDVLSLMETGVDDVRMIGIKGMGGGGKTTLARAVFDQISYLFEGKSFIENVREVSSTSLSGLKSLQNQVLKDVSFAQGINISNVHDGKRMIKRMMRGIKVLVVLDDVDHIDQLAALAGMPNWFSPRSRIIITTRDEQVLVAHRVKLIVDVNLLSYNEAICLFSRYAFGTEIPIQGYGELSGKVVRYANGLPLTITVLGSFLCGKNVSEWIDALKRLETIPLNETLQKLELSYVTLEEDYKEIFLNVACILKGWSKELAIEALESCGFHATNGLKILEQKSLITISKPYEFVGMHDHIEEMGRNIVRRLHPNSRLWIKEEIKDILANDLGTNATRYIRFDIGNVNLEIVMKGLRKMKELRFLHVAPPHIQEDFVERHRNHDNVNQHLPNALQYLPNALQYLHWYKYPLSSFPNTFLGNNLVALKMVKSKIVQLWEGGERKVLNKLKILDLSRSNLMTLDLRSAVNLELLRLDGCNSLVEFHLPGRCLNLKSLTLTYSKLRTLDIGQTPNLKHLDLKGCYYLVEFRLPNPCLELISVNLSGSNLRTIDLHSCVNLKLLDLKYCSALVELHMPGKYLNLRSLTLTYSKLRTLHIGQTPNLEDLDLNNCYDLEDFHMADKCPKLTSLNISYSKLKTLDLGLAPNLKNLNLEECNNLVQLHVPFGCLENLVYLVLSGCLRYTSFLFDKRNAASSSRDESIEVGPLAELHLIAKSLKECPLHPDNTLRKFQFQCFYKDDPSSTGNVEKLLSFGLCACTNLETFSESICGLRRLRKLKLECYPEAPKDLDQLECLEELSISTTDMKHLPDSICMLKHLEILQLKDCWSLEKLPEDLGRLECLKMLTLSDTKIKHLPDSICMLKHLVFLELSDCFYLETLPEDLGQLECLETLDLSYAKIERLPDSICMLKHLKNLVLARCSLLKTLPKDLGELECLLELNMSSSMIKHLPDTICMLKDLEHLNLNHCLLLEKLPDDLDRLESLRSLTLRKCKLLRDIPISICKMKRLERLDVTGTCISNLPHDICLLKRLHILGSRGLLESSGFTSKIQTVQYEDTCFVDV
ncbi:disease resistance protein RPV1 [Lactuca sativa]|uniref:TIR domain-containing protein n=1 Tax=Lactuca sativa TaxID=4236 RepID=A0A9R1WSB1_LACSA|nr:disease resistance protein RPV1 [Lactuca sativa]XP_023744661.1 disease resistance protein RPV1 [Lactuca sativa]KAJ0184607.1 hypothetical protein LSAT_V11C900492700 [Lactuca sativa]